MALGDSNRIATKGLKDAVKSRVAATIEEAVKEGKF